MTITLSQIIIYVSALFVLVISPGPVVAAIVARVLSRGMKAAWPIAAAVMAGDFIWVTIAILAASILAQYDILLIIIRYLGAAYLIWLGIHEIRHAYDEIENAELSKSRAFWPNFLAGFLIIMSNPKAALFYIVFVPQFYDIPKLTGADILMIGIITAIVPFIGNMIWAGAAHIAAKRFKSPKGRAWLRYISGGALVLVGLFLLVY